MLYDTSEDFDILALLTDASGVPVVPDAAPTFRVYGPSGDVGDGTATLADTGNITGITAATPAVVTSNAHGLVTGQVVTIAGSHGVTGVNGARTITVASANTFSLNGTTGGGAYTSGGTWGVTGLYACTIDGSLRASLEPGQSYLLVVYYVVSSVTKTLAIPFTAG